MWSVYCTLQFVCTLQACFSCSFSAGLYSATWIYSRILMIWICLKKKCHSIFHAIYNEQSVCRRMGNAFMKIYIWLTGFMAILAIRSSLLAVHTVQLEIVMLAMCGLRAAAHCSSVYSATSGCGICSAQECGCGLHSPVIRSGVGVCS